MAALPRPSTLVLLMTAFIGLDLLVLGLQFDAPGFLFVGLFVLLAAVAVACFRRLDRGSWNAAFA